MSANVYFHPVDYGLSHIGDGLPMDMAVITNTGNRTRKLVIIGTDEQIALIAQIAYSLGQGTFIKEMRKLAGCPDSEESP
jgi:hypothetical protein